MKMFKEKFLVILIIYIFRPSCASEAICDTGKEIWKLYLKIDNMISTTSFSAFELYKYQVDEIHKQLQKIESSMHSKVIKDVFESRPYPITLYKSLDTLEIFMLSIDQYYDYFRQQIREMSYNGNDLRNVMESVIPHIEEKIITIRRKVLEPNELLKKNLILTIADYVASKQPHLCDNRIISEVLVQLFKTIVIAEMKAHVMSATVNKYQYLPNNEDSRWINHLGRETFEAQIGRYVSLFSWSITITDAAYLRACEPHNDRWIRDKSFYELEGTFQTAIFRYDWKNCHVNTCHDIGFDESRTCEAQYYDDRSSCSGQITECIDLNAIEACVLENGPYKFHHVNSSVKGLLGIPSKCPSSNSYMIEDGSGRNSSYRACACNCYGSHNSISLSIMESNVESGMVIIGLRLVRQHRVLYIQPREGKLNADGRIHRYSERWIPIPKKTLTSQIHWINRHNRVFFLDDLNLSSSFVLTGVKFNRVERKSVIGFAIEIFGMPFNFDSGKLKSDSKFSISKRALDNDLGEPLLFEPINPAGATLPLTVNPANKTYISLKQSSLQTDFGQSTLPLFDAVPVTTYPSSPLSGIGIFYKSADDNAGFLSLRVYGIKYAQFFTNLQATCMKNDRLFFNQTQ